MIDANDMFKPDDAVEYMKQLAPFKPLWVEEPTSPDDILGLAKIAKVVFFFLLQVMAVVISFLIIYSSFFSSFRDEVLIDFLSFFSEKNFRV